MADLLFDRTVYVGVMVLLAIGLYGMLAKRNLVKKIVGMVIFQTAIYLFFIQGAAQMGATVPVIDPELGADADTYVNPLPHLLILTALVVGVGVLGVALSFLLRIYRRHGTFDEDRIAADLAAEEIEGHGVDDHHDAVVAPEQGAPGAGGAGPTDGPDDPEEPRS